MIIIGKTKQSQNRSNEGYYHEEYNPVSLNIYGILPRVALVAPAESSVSKAEDMTYW